MPSLHCVKDYVPAPLVTRIKGSFAQRFVIVRERYVMALSRVLSGDIVETMFDEDFGLSGEEESYDDVVDYRNIRALVGETILTHDDIAPQRDERSEEDEGQDATLFGETTTEVVDITSNQHSLEPNTLNNEDKAVKDRLLENFVPTEVHEEGMCEEEHDSTPNVVSQLTTINTNTDVTCGKVNRNHVLHSCKLTNNTNKLISHMTVQLKPIIV